MKPTSVSLPPSPILSWKKRTINQQEDSHQKSLNHFPIVQKRLSSSSQNLEEEEQQQQPLLAVNNFDANSFIKKTLSNFSVKNLPNDEPLCRPCAYCGEANEIPRHFLYENEAEKANLDDLYCQNCRKLFIERSKSDIQRMLLVQQNEEVGGAESSSPNPRKSGRYSKKETTKTAPPSSSAAARKISSSVAETAVRAQSTWSSCSSLKALCRICQSPGGDSGRSLINPCRCKGTMQFVHSGCLVRWLEISYNKGHSIPKCELCGYHFKMHHCFKIKRLFFPRCSRNDKYLHLTFFIMASVMLGCAIVSALYLRTEKTRIRKALTAEDVFVILSSLVFFCAFFVAVFTQYRARYSLCHLFYRFYLINRHWRVKDYDSSGDFVDRKIPKPKKKQSPRRPNRQQYYHRQTRIVSDV